MSCNLFGAKGAWLAFFLWLGVNTPCQAVIIFEKGKEEPIRGYLVRANDKHVVVNRLLADGQLQQVVIPRANIDVFRNNVDSQLLSKLSPDNPRAYKNYAEDLGAIQGDPDAQATAIRLFLIAAHLDRDEFGRGSLLAMTLLARTPSEERTFRAMAYLLDSDHDRSVLTAPTKSKASPAETLDPADRLLLLKALRAVRTNKKAEAKTRGNAHRCKQALSKFSNYLTRDEFKAATQKGSMLTLTTLKRIVTLELVLLSSESPALSPVAARSSWSQIPDDDLHTAVPALNLETLTEFDPRKCVYRDGQWVEPS